MTRPVLLLGSVPRITIPIARSLHRHGVEVEVASFSNIESPPRSTAISAFHRLASPGDPTDGQPSTLTQLTRLISERHYDMLVPVNDPALAFISEHDAPLRELLYVACPPPEVVKRVLNKSLTVEFARLAGIHTPSTFRISNVFDLHGLADQLHFPLVAKPHDKSGEMQFKVRYFQTYQSLHQALADDERLGSSLLLQEFVVGDGVGIEVLMHRGEALAIFQHRRVKEVPASGGVAAIAIAESPEPMLIDQALKLLRALEWEGVAMVEFRYDGTQRRSALLEVNGRYWGTSALPIQAGMDFPWYEWQIAHGEKPSVPTSYAIGARWRWTAGYVDRWYGLAKTSIRNALRNGALLKELVPSRTDLSSRDAIWDPTDPMPAIFELLRTVKNLAVSDARAILRALNPAPPAKKPA